MGTTLSVLKSGGQEINSSNFRVSTATGDVVLKLVRGDERKAQQLEAQARISEALRGKGLPMPVFVGSRSGALIHRDGENIWSAQRFVEGEYFHSPADAGATARVVNEVTTACAAADAMAPSIDPLPLVDLSDGDPAWRAVNDPAAYAASLGDANVKLLRKHSSRIHHARGLLVEQRAVHRQPIGLCHIDLHPHNLLCASGQVAAVLDFESFRRAPRATLVAYGCYKLLRQVAVSSQGDERAVAAFRRALRLSSLLGAETAAEHTDFAVAEILRRMCTVLRLNVTAGDTTWNHMLEVMIRALYEAPVVLGLEGA